MGFKISALHSRVRVRPLPGSPRLRLGAERGLRLRAGRARHLPSPTHGKGAVGATSPRKVRWRKRSTRPSPLNETARPRMKLRRLRERCTARSSPSRTRLGMTALLFVGPLLLTLLGPPAADRAPDLRMSAERRDRNLLRLRTRTGVRATLPDLRLPGDLRRRRVAHL